MGCCASTPQDAKDNKHRSEEIDAHLKLEMKRQRHEVKLLLLGAGESGKSTLFRQMKLIHVGRFTSEELDGYREVIVRNTIDSMRAILAAMTKLNIPYEASTSADHAAVLRSAGGAWDAGSTGDVNGGEEGVLAPRVADAIEALWRDGGVQDCYRRSREYQLNDSAAYFFEAVRRVSQPDFIPTDDDVLRCRVKSTGISEITYKINNDTTFRLVDVGGQRSERKKWIHCFEGVTALVFMVAVNEYDMTLIEDAHVNRMREALYLFDSICNNKWFANTAVILLMNKVDLLREKILVSPLQDYFPDYTGGPSYERALDFITDMFVSLHKSSTREIYSHRTCATETANVRTVMEDVARIITNRNLRASGFL